MYRYMLCLGQRFPHYVPRNTVFREMWIGVPEKNGDTKEEMTQVVIKFEFSIFGHSLRYRSYKN